jgi:hypothetical protein
MASGGKPFEVVQAGLSRCQSEIRCGGPFGAFDTMRCAANRQYSSVDLEIEGLQGQIVNTTAHAKASANRVGLPIHVIQGPILSAPHEMSRPGRRGLIYNFTEQT